MEQNLTQQVNRGDFVKLINDTLIEKGFIKDPEKELWEYTRNINTGKRVVIVNGHRQDIPGDIHRVKYIVDVFGDGHISDADTREKREFLQVVISIMQNEEERFCVEECIYYDEIEYFNTLMGRIFN